MLIIIVSQRFGRKALCALLGRIPPSLKLEEEGNVGFMNDKFTDEGIKIIGCSDVINMTKRVSIGEEKLTKN